MLLGPLSVESTASCVTLLLGSSVNQDGRSSSLTAPNGPAQQDAILTTLASADNSPAEIISVQVCYTTIVLLFLAVPYHFVCR